jgi:predicted TIM-barrel fold metal-dependent hydrolase
VGIFADKRLGRRSVLAGGLLAVSGAFATAQEKPFRIDVHHHVSPPAWLEAVKKAKLDTPPMVKWSVAQSLEDMEKGGVATAMVSPTTPQLNFLNDPATSFRIARESNEYCRRIADDHPGRFGLFAMLPMPHVEESLKSIAYAFDMLHADGIGMMTSYGDKWLGYPEFFPVFDELNRRKAVVYTHPTLPNCCVNLVAGVPEVAVEYGADTTRSITNLIYSGASRRWPNISFIFSHGGGVLTAVSERLLVQMPARPPYLGKITPGQVAHELNRFFYDTAQVANAVTIDALAKLVPTSQIVFGSDFPYRSSAEHVSGLAAHFSGDILQAIGRDNAARILPGVKTM